MTNPIESTFATVRLWQRVTKGPGWRAAGIAMAFNFIESAQTRWRAVNAPHLVALVRAGARFEKGSWSSVQPRRRATSYLVPRQATFARLMIRRSFGSWV
jgi:hypothetical protein